MADDLYFLRVKDGPVKIGRSKDVHHRWRHTQTHCPYDIEVLGIITGEGRMEKVWHEAFYHYRMRGEWYEWSRQLQKCIEAALVGEDWIGLLQPNGYFVFRARQDWEKTGGIPGHRNPRDWARTVWINLIADREEDVLCAA